MRMSDRRRIRLSCYMEAIQIKKTKLSECRSRKFRGINP